MRGQASYGVRCNTWLQQNCLQNKLKRPVTLSILISVLYKLVPPSAWDPFCQLEVDQAELLCEERTLSFQNSFVKVNLSHFASPRSIWAAGNMEVGVVMEQEAASLARMVSWVRCWSASRQTRGAGNLIRFNIGLGSWSVSSPTAQPSLSKGPQIRSQPSHNHNLYETGDYHLFL